MGSKFLEHCSDIPRQYVPSPSGLQNQPISGTTNQCFSLSLSPFLSISKNQSIKIIIIMGHSRGQRSPGYLLRNRHRGVLVKVQDYFCNKLGFQIQWPKEGRCLFLFPHNAPQVEQQKLVLHLCFTQLFRDPTVFVWLFIQIVGLFCTFKT